jgi:hypothetical protein
MRGTPRLMAQRIYETQGHVTRRKLNPLQRNMAYTGFVVLDTH